MTSYLFFIISALLAFCVIAIDCAFSLWWKRQLAQDDFKHVAELEKKGKKLEKEYKFSVIDGAKRSTVSPKLVKTLKMSTATADSAFLKELEARCEDEQYHFCVPWVLVKPTRTFFFFLASLIVCALALSYGAPAAISVAIACLIALVDIEFHQIPRVLSIILCAFIWSAVCPLMSVAYVAVVFAIIWFMIWLMVRMANAIFKKTCFGAGDIWLMSALLAPLIFVSDLAFFYLCALAIEQVVLAIYMLIKHKKEAIPFAPFCAIALGLTFALGAFYAIMPF